MGAEQQNPYTSPGTSPEKPATDTARHVAAAAFVPRFIGHAIDFAVFMALLFVAGVVAGFFIAILRRAGVVGPNEHRGTRLGLALWVLLARTLYPAICEGVGGATVGKLALGMRVRSEDLTPASLGSALLRSLGLHVDTLFLGAIAYGSMLRSPMKQRLGDKWGHTVVVYASSLPPGATVPDVNLGLLLGCVAVVAVVATALVTGAL
jgi:uncharacterized RDD family membrane protein YckC